VRGPELVLAFALAAGCEGVVTFHLDGALAPPDLSPRTLDFSPAVDLPLDLQASGLALADFDRDGRIDLVAGTLSTDRLTLMLNRGGGSFDASRLTVATGPSAVAADDFDGDGRIDLAVAHRVAPGGSLLLGNGDGTFRPPAPFPAAGASALASADLNGDQVADLVLTQAEAHTIGVRLAAGATLRDGPTYATGMDRPNAVAAADVDEDALPDVVVAGGPLGQEAEALVFLNRGDGTLDNPIPFLVAPRGADALAIADVNEDGLRDLACANTADGTVSLLLGRGKGRFRDARVFSVGKQPSALLLADLDHDGHADLAVADQLDDAVLVLRGRGDGTFGDPTSHPVGDRPSAIASADLDGDGALDLVTLDLGGPSVSVLLTTAKR
jgi:hypothetical protein